MQLLLILLIVQIKSILNRESIAYDENSTISSFLTITNNLSSSDYHLFSLERSDKYEEVQKQRAITANYNFSVGIYMTSIFCTNYTYIYSVNSSINSSYQKIVQDSDIPSTCKSPYKYFINITNNLTEIYGYSLYYKSTMNRYYIITDKYSKQDESEFTIDLYIKSDNCTSYTYICTVNSTFYKSNNHIVNDSDVPDECQSDSHYFIRIKNNFTIDSYVLYYSSSDGMYTKIDDTVSLKAALFFTTKIYMTSDFCLTLTHVCTINSTTNLLYEVAIQNSDAPESCQSPYQYFLTIVNSFTESNFHLYHQTNSGKYEEIGFRYSESSNASFSVNVYMTSYNCQQYTFVCTVESSTNEDYEKVIQNSDAPSACQLIYYITVANSFSRTDYHLYYLSSNERYEKIDDSLTVEKNYQFSIDLYMTSLYCTNYNFISTINSSLDEQSVSKISDSYAPMNCKSESQYYLTIVNGFTINEYHLYYRSKNSIVYNEIENSFYYSYPFSFSFDIYMTSDHCQSYTQIETARSSTDKTYEKVFSNSDAPESCQPRQNFLTIFNNFTSPDYLLYYSLDNRRLIDIEDSVFIEDLTEFSVYLYMKSDQCSQQTKIGQYDSSKDKAYVKKINDDDAPESCQSPYKYFVTITNNFTLSDYHLYYLNNESNGYVEIKSSLYLENTESFAIDLYMKSDFCTQYTYFYTIDSEQSRLFEKVINNLDAPQNCSVYEICFDLSNLSSDYSIGYACSYDNESELNTASRESNVVRCDKPFSVATYLSSSPFCGDKYKLKILNGEIDSSCIMFDDTLIPDECKDGGDSESSDSETWDPEIISESSDDDDSGGSDDAGSGSKKTNVGLIVGLTCGIFVLVAAGIIIGIIIYKKRHNGGYTFFNRNEGTNINEDISYTNVETN